MSVPSFTPEEGMAASNEMLKQAMALPAHDLALTALLSAYAAIAVRFSCCQPSGIANLRRLADTLESMQALGSAAGHHIH